MIPRTVFIAATLVGAIFYVAGAGVGSHAACLLVGQDQSTVVIHLLGILTGFDPICVSVASGTTVTWDNQDSIAHDPGSELDGGTCFRSRFHFNAIRPQNEQNQDLRAGETYSVKFTYDGSEAESNFTKPAGGWIVRDCIPAADSDSSEEELVIPYICFRHPTTMKGTLVVRNT